MKSFKSLNFKEKMEYIGILAIYPLILLYEQIGKSVKFLNTRKRQITASILTVCLMLTMIPLSAITAFASASEETYYDFRMTFKATKRLSSATDNGNIHSSYIQLTAEGMEATDAVDVGNHFSGDPTTTNNTIKVNFGIKQLQSGDSANGELTAKVKVLPTSISNYCYYASFREAKGTITLYYKPTSSNTWIQYYQKTNWSLLGQESDEVNIAHTYHVAGSDWISDADAHWHKCLNDCTQVHGYTTHSQPADDGDLLTPIVCSTCNYVFKEAADHVHEQTEFKNWTAASGELTTGNYCLTKSNATALDSDISIPENAVVTICLNGHTLDMGSNYIDVKDGAVLNICDCQSSQGKITSTHSYQTVFNRGVGSVTVSGGTVTNTEGGGIRNYSTGSVTVSGGSVSSAGSYGITNNEGTLLVSAGKVTGADYAISNYGGALYISGNPTISGNDTDYADLYLSSGNIYAQSNAATPTAYSGGILSVYVYNAEDGNVVVNNVTTGTNGNANKFTFTNEGYTLKLVDDDLVLAKTHTHTGVEGEFEEWTATSGDVESGNYYLSGNVTATANITVPEGVTVNLCLNGYKLDLGSIYFYNYGTLIICDCTANGEITGAGYYCLYNQTGTLNFLSGTVSATGRYGYGIRNHSTGTVNFSGGRITANGTEGYGIFNNSTGKVIVSGGEISSAYRGVYTTSGTVEVTGGTISAESAGIFNEWGTVTVSGGTVSSTGTSGNGIYNRFDGTVNVSGGTISGTTNGIYNYSEGTITVSGGTVTGKNGVRNNADGTVTVSGTAKITGTTESAIENRGTLTVNGGTLEGDGYGIENISYAKATVTGGKISGNYAIFNDTNSTLEVGATAIITATVSYGILNYGTATVTGGTITGISCGITNSDFGGIYGNLAVSGGNISGKVGLRNDKKCTVHISGTAKITGTTDYGIKNSGTVYLSGAPDISTEGSSSTAIYINSGSIYAENSDAEPLAYTGGALSLDISNPKNNIGKVIVNNVTDGNKGSFTLTDSNYRLKQSGDDLVLAYNDDIAPTGKISVGTNHWNEFLNTITFGLFFKETQSVTITADDNLSGVKEIAYYLANGEMSKDQLDALQNTDWTVDDEFNINPENKYIIYAKITDNAGNVTYISTNGIVLFKDTEITTGEYEYTLTTKADIVTNIKPGNNTVNMIDICEPGGGAGDALTYSINPEGYLVLEGDSIEAFAINWYSGDYTVTVAYNALGEEYGSEAKGDKITDTVITLKVHKAEGRVEILAPISKTYNGTPVEEPHYERLSTGEVIIEYKARNALDSAYTTIAPIEAGEYTVRVTVAEDKIYKKAFATSDFVIQKKPLSVRDIYWNISGSPFTYDGTEKSITLEGALPAGVIVEKSGDTATNAGSYTATATFKLAEGYSSNNYAIFGAVDNKLSANWTINPKAVSAVVTVIPNTYTYTGEPIIPSLVKVMDGGTEIPAREYMLAYEDNVNAGIATVKVTDIVGGNYTVNATENFVIGKATPAADFPTDLSIATGKKLSDIDLPAGYTWDNPDTAVVYGINKYDMTYTKQGPAAANYNPVTEEVEVNGLDVTAPTGEIILKNNRWNEFLNNITFGLFFKETQSITITAADTESGIKEIAYYLATEELSKDDVKALENNKWTVYTDAFNVEPDNKYVVYARITDNAGNVIYLGSDGIVLDSIKPVIAGVEDGKDFYGDATFTVDEDYLDTVTLDGEPIEVKDGKYSVPADNKEHTIVVTDKTGNQVTYKLTVYKNYKVSFVVDGKEIEASEVGYGNDATLPEIPKKDGYTAKWDVDGKNITADTVITAVYEKIPQSPQTGDNTNIWLWLAVMFVSGLSIFGIVITKKHKEEEAE